MKALKSLFPYLFIAITIILVNCNDEADEVKSNCNSDNNIISEPYTNSEVQSGDTFSIIWNVCEEANINLLLFREDSFIRTIKRNIPNTSEFDWNVAPFPNKDDYQVVITNANGDHLAKSSKFSINFSIEQKPFTDFVNESISIGNKTLQMYSGGTGEITLLFELGAGAFQQECIGSEATYFSNQLISLLSDSVRFIAYDRAGYFSFTNGEVRDLQQLSSDLNELIVQKVQTEKLILIGASWGAHIIRYFAINNPDKVNALLFLDPDHEEATELNCCLTQQDEDNLVNYCLNNNCEGCAEEYKQLIETIDLMHTLPNLPDVPVRVISGNHGDFGEGWVESHANLGEGVNNFKQVICECQHQVAKFNPEIVLFQIKELINAVK